MARRRFFVDEVRNGEAEISGEDALHLTRVLRVEVGQKFEISDNYQVWLASVEMARKELVRFRVIEELAASEAIAPVTLYLALIKFDRFEWSVEKATELGVARIVPVEADRSERGLFAGASKRVERWRRIAKEASEQSRRLRMPAIDEPVRIAETIGTHTAACRIWFDERPEAEPLLRIYTGGEAALAVGPEGGWTDHERAGFTAAGWKAASLGPLVLRAETAVCAALAVVSQLQLK
jgi:16S rRNA (uracil1498-N3)-methyltransferase